MREEEGKMRLDTTFLSRRCCGFEGRIEMEFDHNKAASRSDSQLALQGHGGIYALAERGDTVIHRNHLGVHQTAAGVALEWTTFPIFGGRHARLLHSIKLDCKNKRT